MVEVVVVGLDQLRQVLRRDPLLVGGRAPLDALHAGLQRPLQIEDEVRPGDGLGEKRVEAVVDHQLRVVQVQAREDLVLGEVVIRHDEVREEVDLGDLTLLLVAGKEKEELRLESRARLLLVELGKEGVVHVLQDLGAVEPFGEQVHERRLADSDRSIDRHVAQRDVAFRGNRHRARF